MFFMILGELDIDWGPIKFWANIILWAIVFKMIGLPLLRGFLLELRKEDAPRNDARETRTGRHSSKKLPAPFRIKDAYVIDGDTLARGDWRIRIYGMDAPESDQPGGSQATEQMRTLVEGKTLHILPKDVDIYGRLVARVRTGQYDVGAEMVKSGHAVATSDFTRAYSSAERDARKTRSGLWKTGAITDPKAWREAGKEE